MPKKKSTRGGVRKGSGRKPVDDPKIVFAVYPRQSWIDKIGKDRAKEVAEKAIEREYKKLK